eukprot:c22976_g1_i2 orf=121-1446(+)
MEGLPYFPFAGRSFPPVGKKWGCFEYALGIAGVVTVSMVLFITIDYEVLQKSLTLWSSLEQPNLFTPALSETLLVNLSLVKGAVQKGAVCLDGSAPGYHLHKGHGLGENSWLVHLEGGGWCSSNESCALRASTRLGSSHYMESAIFFNGIFSNSPMKNPDFYNWNRVKVRYCDGGSFSGEIDSPIVTDFGESNQVKEIYHRGQRVWQAIMEDLLLLGMSKADRAILSGCSAGGLASILHCDNFRSQLPSKADVKCLSDAGLFLDVQDVSGKYRMRSFYQRVVAQHGIATNLPKGCKAERDPNQCFFPQYLLKYMRTPLFILQPAYDTWQIENVLGSVQEDPSRNWKFCITNPASCSKEQLKILQGFREHLLLAIGSIEGGLYINSCFIHCQTELDLTWHGTQASTVNNKTIAEAIGEWFLQRKQVKDIDCAYPCNPTCFHE